MHETDLPLKLIQVSDAMWCHAGTPWHYKPHPSPNGVGSYVPEYWRKDMFCGLPNHDIRAWEMRILFAEGQFKEPAKCQSCGQYQPEGVEVEK